MRLQKTNPCALPQVRAVQPWQDRDFSGAIRPVWPAEVAVELMGRFRHNLKTGKPHRSHDISARHRDLGVTQVSDRQIQRITPPSGSNGVVCFFTEFTGRRRAKAARNHSEMPPGSGAKQAPGIISRRTAETCLEESKRRRDKSHKEGRALQARTRRLSHRLLRAHEDERKRIGYEMRDGIVQPLTVINGRLQSLTRSATVDPAALPRRIARTRRVVEQSIRVMHRFARDLRPALLADLGLVPALRTHLEEFSQRTGLRSPFCSFSGVEQLDRDRRTVLCRVAQSALGDVARHTGATRVSVSLRKIAATMRLKIHDNRQSLAVVRLSAGRGNIHPGFAGSRERVEMAGGTSAFESAAGRGTTVCACVPFGRPRRPGGGG